MDTVTLTKALQDLDGLLDQAIESGQPVVITRKGKPDVALIAAADLPKPKKAKTHSAHLFRSKEARKELEKAAADFDAGRKVGWSGTWEEFDALSKSLLADAAGNRNRK